MLTTEQIAHFETFGFLILRQLLSRDEIAIMKRESVEIFDEVRDGMAFDGKQREPVQPFFERRPFLSKLVENDRIYGIGESLLGPDFFLIGTEGNLHVGDTQWHGVDLDSDYGGSPHVLQSVKIAFYLDPLDKNTGCLRVIPGSHRRPFSECLQVLKNHINETPFGVSGAEMPGVTGEAGRGTGFLVGPGDAPFHAVIMDETTHVSPADGLTAHVLIDPLPSNLAIEVPQGGVGEASALDVPQFTTDEGLAGIAFFLAGFTDFGQSVNGMLGELVTSVTGGAIDDQRTDFSFGVELDADQSFDLVIDAQQGRMALDEPEWLHGISVEADLAEDNHTAFRARLWLPDLAPTIDLSINYQNLTVTDRWDIDIELDGWVPANPEFMIEVNNYNGRDLHLMLLGFEPGQSTDLKIESQITTDYRPVVPQLSIFSNYEMSHSLDAIHVTLLDRTESTRYELLLQGIPEQLDMTASLGSMLSVGMEADDPGQTGLSIDSLMLQMNRFNAGKWWPATVFLHELPRQMNLTTAPSTIFDITKPISFQGMSTLIFSSSGPGMDLFISTTGRAVESRGDSLLLAQNLASHMSIEPTEDFGLRVMSSGDGIERLYLRQNDVPAQPGMWLDQLEAAGENLKSATIHLSYIGSAYPIVTIEDVRGGRIIVNARATVDIGQTSFDGRAVLIDAQVTGGIPTGTTIGVNGLASDLSILNLMGTNAQTTHYLLPEPLTTAIATGVATLLG